MSAKRAKEIARNVLRKAKPPSEVAEPIGEFMVRAFRCRCGHEWVPANLRQAARPRVCPKCKSPYWDRPYQFRRVNGKREPVDA